jgi:ADP-ribosylglycohydrolase
MKLEVPMEREHPSPDKSVIPFKVKATAALLGAAVGDALGWPEEGRATLATRKSAEAWRGDFVSWTKRAGGRFYAHEEEIAAGDYSDDTQLIIATSRSLLDSPDWFRVFTRIELPLWTAYERGGGGATKRAAESWLVGRTPWDSAKMEPRRYFEAGGNGVVMRILPHCIWGAQDSEFSSIAAPIVRNGISTHGHPRALVGALAYGFAVWQQFKSSETLGYGALVDLLLDSHRLWSVFPGAIPGLHEWLLAADASLGGSYLEHWGRTVDEQMLLLKVAKEGMSKGALAVDQEVLRQLGCYDKQVSGSGTIAAAAAVFLASRYAADPMNGVLEAAYSRGADTDTLASLVGALLGAVNGIDWLGPLVKQVQDGPYLHKLAAGLCDQRNDPDVVRKEVTQGVLRAFQDDIVNHSPGDVITLPDGQEALVGRVLSRPVGGGKFERYSAFCQTRAGQSMSLSTIRRSNRQHTEYIRGDVATKALAERVVLRIIVQNLEHSLRFYSYALGLRVTNRRAGIVTVGNMLALCRRDSTLDQSTFQFEQKRQPPPFHITSVRLKVE